MAEHEQAFEEGVVRGENGTDDSSRGVSFELQGGGVHNPVELSDNGGTIHVNADPVRLV